MEIRSLHREDTSIALRMVEFYKKDPDNIIEGDYDKCTCGRRKLHSDRMCGSCHDGVMSFPSSST